MITVIAPELFPQTGGQGQFAACPPTAPNPANRIKYTVTNGLLSVDGKLTPGPFTSKLEQLLRAHGWSAFTGQGGTALSTSGGYSVQLQPVQDNANVDVTDSPTPTTPLPTP